MKRITVIYWMLFSMKIEKLAKINILIIVKYTKWWERHIHVAQFVMFWKTCVAITAFKLNKNNYWRCFKATFDCDVFWMVFVASVTGEWTGLYPISLTTAVGNISFVYADYKVCSYWFIWPAPSFVGIKLPHYWSVLNKQLTDLLQTFP